MSRSPWEDLEDLDMLDAKDGIFIHSFIYFNVFFLVLCDSRVYC